MTRINTVPVKELHYKHLIAEVRELPRMGNYIAKSVEKHKGNIEALEQEIPTEYRMGTGHVKFFYNKIGYLTRRHAELIAECKARKYRIKPIDWLWRVQGKVPDSWFTDWEPTPESLAINRERIMERLGV